MASEFKVPDSAFPVPARRPAAVAPTAPAPRAWGDWGRKAGAPQPKPDRFSEATVSKAMAMLRFLKTFGSCKLPTRNKFNVLGWVQLRELTLTVAGDKLCFRARVRTHRNSDQLENVQWFFTSLDDATALPEWLCGTLFPELSLWLPMMIRCMPYDERCWYQLAHPTRDFHDFVMEFEQRMSQYVRPEDVSILENPVTGMLEGNVSGEEFLIARHARTMQWAIFGLPTGDVGRRMLFDLYYVERDFAESVKPSKSEELVPYLDAIALTKMFDYYESTASGSLRRVCTKCDSNFRPELFYSATHACYGPDYQRREPTIDAPPRTAPQALRPGHYAPSSDEVSLLSDEVMSPPSSGYVAHSYS